MKRLKTTQRPWLFMMAGLIMAYSRADTTAELRAKADAVIIKELTDNVSAAKEAGAVFAAANRLAAEQDNRGAIFYFVKGLELSPWDMSQQLNYAKVLLTTGKEAEAKTVARLVYKTTEQDDVLQESAQIAGLAMPDMPAPFIALPEAYQNPKAICLVKIGPVSDWIIQRAAQALAEKLGAPMFIYPEVLALPLPTRSAYDRWAKNLKNDISWQHPFVVRQMKLLKIQSRADATADQTLDLLAILSKAQGQEITRERLEEIKNEAKENDAQWDAALLLKLLADKVPLRADIVYVGVTGVDMYTDDNNYVFGQAQVGNGFCVISYKRYRADFNREHDNQARLLERVHKQLLSSVGFALGVPRPTDPRSARSYPNSLEEHDRKALWLDAACIQGFEAALGYALPEKTKEESRKGQL